MPHDAEEHIPARRDDKQTTTLQLNPDGSLVHLEAQSWLVCLVPGIEKQWWHPFFHKVHKHVFALRPGPAGFWTVFEPWWTRIVAATMTAEQAKKFLRWGARGDVLMVRECIPGRSSQIRGWMTCAALVNYLLGRPYFVWTPHGLYRLLLRESNACHVDVSMLLEDHLGRLADPGGNAALACGECNLGEPWRGAGAPKPFCMKRGRDLVPLDDQGRYRAKPSWIVISWLSRLLKRGSGVFRRR